jgi:hypothetical protein
LAGVGRSGSAAQGALPREHAPSEREQNVFVNDLDACTTATGFQRLPVQVKELSKIELVPKDVTSWQESDEAGARLKARFRLSMLPPEGEQMVGFNCLDVLHSHRIPASTSTNRGSLKKRFGVDRSRTRRERSSRSGSVSARFLPSSGCARLVPLSFRGIHTHTDHHAHAHMEGTMALHTSLSPPSAVAIRALPHLAFVEPR